MYVALNVNSLPCRVCLLEIGKCGFKVGMCLVMSVNWKLVYVAVNVGSLPCRVCLLEIGVRGCKCRLCAL